MPCTCILQVAFMLKSNQRFSEIRIGKKCDNEVSHFDLCLFPFVFSKKYKISYNFFWLVVVLCQYIFVTIIIGVEIVKNHKCM